jgi:hypothetical protein
MESPELRDECHTGYPGTDFMEKEVAVKYSPAGVLAQTRS